MRLALAAGDRQAQGDKPGPVHRPQHDHEARWAASGPYKGHPLYYFVRDKDAGDAYGQGLKAFGAEWYVLAGHCPHLKLRVAGSRRSRR
jgi:predicted lipoprotein with Yx(FWY)xxD motif